MLPKQTFSLDWFEIVSNLLNLSKISQQIILNRSLCLSPLSCRNQLVNNTMNGLVVLPCAMLRGIPHMNQYFVWILPGQADDLFKASKDIFACVVVSDRRHRLHKVHNGVGVLGQIDADNSFISVVMISITNESHANLDAQSRSWSC